MKPWVNLLFLLFVLHLLACTPAQRINRSMRNSSLFKEAFTGYKIIDLSTGRTISRQQSQRYFTPGSNVKLLTLYTCLHQLPDSLVAFRWQVQDTCTIYQGMADPSHLHPKFVAWHRSRLPHRSAANYLDVSNWHGQPYGSGWMWDDLNTAFSAPMSAMPVFGNTAIVSKINKEWVIEPSSAQFPVKYQKGLDRPLRQMLNDTLLLPLHFEAGAKTYIPFWSPDDVTMRTHKLLPLPAYRSPSKSKWKTVYSTPIDTVLRYMMQESDNFFAEQLLLQCAGLWADSLNTDLAIQAANRSWFQTHPTPPYWVDGSGLSHYNLLTPDFMTWLLSDLWKSYDHQRILGLLAAGGVSGTLAHRYKSPEGKPYVFAKTGTLRGVHSLSGYLQTRRGRWLAFSFMHNNYLGSSARYRDEMEIQLLRMWREL